MYMYCFLIVLRYKLSKHLNACIMDRSCSSSCQHKYKEVSALIISNTTHISSLSLSGYSDCPMGCCY